MQKILELSSTLRNIMMFFFFGFITHYQLNGTTVEKDSTVQVVVLDVAKTEHLVDLSLKPEFLDRHREDSSNSQVGKKKCRRETRKEL